MRAFHEETFTVFDLETTGGRPESEGILEIAMVKIRENKLAESYDTLVNAEFPIPPIVRRMTGISSEMVANAPVFEKIAEEVSAFIGSDILVVHNAPFDYQFLNFYLERSRQLTLTNPLLCTVKLGERLVPDSPNRKLEILAGHLGIPFENPHRAWSDADATARVFLACLTILEGQGIHTLAQLVRWMSKPFQRDQKKVKAEKSDPHPG